MIYLDNSATTKPCAEAVEAVAGALTRDWGNPSALYDFGISAARQLRTARHAVAAAMGAEPDRVFFTSCGTEADNWAVYGTAKRFGKRGKHIVTTAMEHHAILNCMKDLEAQGFEVTYLQPDALGNISADALKAALRKDTILVSVMMVNNEAGSVMPIAQMAKLTHRLCPDAIFHTDAVQGFLKIPFQAKTLGADLISVSSHKIHGPKGAGALYISPRLKSFPPLIQGGGQEGGYRSGTEGTPALFGFAAAAEAGGKTFREDIARERGLLENLCAQLEALPGVQLNGAHDAPHILSVSIPGVPTQNSINILQDAGICVSAGSACAKGHRSHVLTAMGVSEKAIDSAFRVSLSRETTQEDIDALVWTIRENILPRI
ncbi:cysteine desulfurase [Pseudoflavonifractor sp. MSJ-30]|uniref:cysteine desulfurase family protein n=1 Tax=Pseudoflavonifractor sp. MSJ-30 TaxID=2841525 RepID=UPI001C11D99E|nr:cysteine desulfurase family protein [Pseudoflavonifractor sp. MSJ-30]MBU5453046.1 cysteine desulfurase [Pseudoflavonifractor sp. MSJ-30]